METITLTICDRAENHVGMQKIGQISDSGFSLNDLLKIRDWFVNQNIDAKLIDLNYPIEECGIYPDDEAYILIIRNGVDFILGPDYNSNDLFAEQMELDWDSKAFIYGRVVNKKARHNLCYGSSAQAPNYEKGKGRVIAYKNVPLLFKLKNRISDIMTLDQNSLVAEGNYYYDITKCGIGYHGDSERKKVIGVRLGAIIPLVYQWYLNSERIGSKIHLELNHGDIYIMSEKATGNDWKKRSICTLRHAAGCDKFIK